MKKRKILLPLAWLYGLGVWLRNLLYDYKLLPTQSFDLPMICIGNLSVGGTGKSPHTMYLIDLLKDQYHLATLSRGYGRKTKGFIVANKHSTANEIGDEPMQFYNRYNNFITVAVGEDRAKAVALLLQQNQPQVILLDDGYQHRKIKAGLNIILTNYHDLFCNDLLLPAGGLREPESAKKRAQILVVTKCPVNLSVWDQQVIINKIKPMAHQQVYFSTIMYHDSIYNIQSASIPQSQWQQYHVLLVTGIAKSNQLTAYANQHFASVKQIKYPDHHNYTQNNINRILAEHQSIPQPNIILTTEKDFMRLRGFAQLHSSLYYLPIQIEINQAKKFQQQILDYVRSNQKSGQLH